MGLDLKNRYGGWAVITGASSGIGESFARLLAAEGLPLVLVARREDRLVALAERCQREHGVECQVVAEDLVPDGAVQRVVAATQEREIGILVNNAGFGFSGRFLDNDADTYERMIKLNCVVPTLLTHALLPAMLARGRGALITLASIAGYQPTPFFAVYGATKAFDLMLGEALWDELRGTGIDSIALSPGETKTEFSAQAHFAVDPAGADADAVALSALKRLGSPSVVPGLMNKLSAFAHRALPRGMVASITGQVLARRLQQASPAELRKRPYDGDGGGAR